MPSEKKYTMGELQAELAQRGLVVRRSSGPLAKAHAARKTKQAAPRVLDSQLNLDLDLDLDLDPDTYDDLGAPNAPGNPTVNNNDCDENPASGRAKIIVHWVEKPHGSPGRGKSGYNLKKKLCMLTRSYSLVLSGIKVLLMRQPGIDMTATITNQDEDILRHVLKKAAKQYPEFDIFAKQGRWPLRAFVHAILRSSANVYQENSGQRQSRKKKGEEAVENHLPAVDKSMRDDTMLLASIPLPPKGNQLQPADESMRDGQQPALDESIRVEEPPFGMDPLGDDPRFHIPPEPNAEPQPEEPELPSGVFDDEDNDETQNHAVDKVLKNFRNVTLDSASGEDPRVIDSAATRAAHSSHPGQGKSAPPTHEPCVQAPPRKSTPPTSLATKPNCVPASRSLATKDHPARAPTHKLPPSSVDANPPLAPQRTRVPASHKPTTQASSVRAPTQPHTSKSAVPDSAPTVPLVQVSKPVATPSPNPPPPMSDSDGEDIGIASEMLAKLERMAKNPKYRAKIPAAYKGLVDKLFPVSDDVATSTTASTTTSAPTRSAATSTAAPTTASTTASTATSAPASAAPKTNSRPKPKMRSAPKPEVPEVDESDLTDASASLSNPPVDPAQEAAPSPLPAKRGPGRPKKGAGVGDAIKDVAAKAKVDGAQGAKRGKKAAGPANGDMGEGSGAGKTATKGKAAAAAKVPAAPTRRSTRESKRPDH